MIRVTMSAFVLIAAVVNTVMMRTSKTTTIEMRHIDASILSLGANTTYLNMYNSKVETIDHNSFIGSENSLLDIIIRNSKLTPLLPPAFSKLTNLDELEISNNIVSSSRITLRRSDTDNLQAGLDSLSLDMCNIENIESDAFIRFGDMTTLTLQGNFLTSLDRIHIPSKIGELFLTNNKLTKIPIIKLSQQAYMFLETNKITELPSEEDARRTFIKRSDILFLKGNKLDCSCEMKWIVKYNRNSSIFDLNDGLCHQVAGQTKKKDITALTKEDFENCTNANGIPL